MRRELVVRYNHLLGNAIILERASDGRCTYTEVNKEGDIYARKISPKVYRLRRDALPEEGTVRGIMNC